MRPGVDPEWTPRDRAVALAWQLLENDKCPGCGHSWSEASASEAFNDYVAEGLVCHSCAAREREAKRFRANEHGPPPGLYVAVRRYDDVM